MKKVTLLKAFFSIFIGFSQAASAQSVGLNTWGAPNSNSIFEISATNKGILIPRIDYANRPVINVATGMLIFVTSNGPDGNNGFYYFNGSAWVRYYHIKEQQNLALSNDTLYINPGNNVDLGNIFPIQGYIKCGFNYINPLTNNSNCGSCGNVCPSGKTCTNGTCL